MQDLQLQDFWADSKLSDEKAGNALVEAVTALVNDHARRINSLTKAVSVYDNCDYESLISAAMQTPATDWRNEQEITFNVLRSIVATLNSKISKNKILPRIVTTNGKWIKREQAMRLDKYIRGLFFQLEAHGILEQANLDCLLSGDGFVKVCNDGDKVWLERVMPDEVFVDYTDGMYGKPCEMYQTRIVNIRDAMQQYPDHADELLTVWESSPDLLQITSLTQRSRITTRCCVIVEAWSLPCGKEPGSHIVSIGNHVLFREEWKDDYFPFIHLMYSQPQRGYYTKGLYQEIAPIQREITEVARRYSKIQNLMSSPKIFYKKSSVTPAALITNEIGQMIEVQEMSDIQVWSPPPLGGDLLMYLNQLIARAYEISGISQLSATSKLPAGIDGASGKALREYNDIETERFALLAQTWEKVHKQLAELLIKEIAKNGDFFVKSFDRNSPLEVISFKDLGITIDDIVISIFPVSSLPARPEAKLQAVNELIQQGFADKRDAMELLDMPDLDAYSEKENAPKGAVDRIINKIIDDQIYIIPEPMLDLDYLKNEATKYYNMVFKNYPVDDNGEFDEKTNVILDMLRQLMEDCAEMLKANEPPPPAPAAGLPEGLGIQPTPELLGMEAAGGGTPVAGGMLPPEAAALIGGM